MTTDKVSARSRARATLGIATTLLATACGPQDGTPVTGQVKPTSTATQSETAINISIIGSGTGASAKVVTVTYNDETGQAAKVLYPDKYNRKVLSGASLMGWSNSTDNGQSFHYGGHVNTPPGVAVLWGDPGITSVPFDPSRVFIQNLAVSSERYAAINNGQGIDGLLDSPLPPNNLMALDGAAIARSVDGGKKFGDVQFVTNNHHFYDGGCMAASNDGTIYASWVDMTASLIDIWRADTSSSPFQKLLHGPFDQLVAAGAAGVISHPRLRVDHDNHLWAAALVRNLEGGGVSMMMARFIPEAGLWEDPFVVSGNLKVADYPSVQFADRVLRAGPQLAFDVGRDEQNNDEIRAAYTVFDPSTNRLVIVGSRCDFNGICQVVNQWATVPANFGGIQSDQFNPTISWNGFFAPDSRWEASYLTRQEDPAGDTVAVYAGAFGRLPANPPNSGTPIFVPLRIVSSHVVCSTLGGYWGDYDGLAVLTQNYANNTTQFIKAFTDSSAGGGCVDAAREQYTSTPVHVSAIVF